MVHSKKKLIYGRPRKRWNEQLVEGNKDNQEINAPAEWQLRKLGTFMHDGGRGEDMKNHAILDRIMSVVEFHTTGLIRGSTHSVFLSDTRRQRFSNYGPRSTSGPRCLSVWSFKKDVHQTIAENFRVWKLHLAIVFHFFSQYWHFMKFITLPAYRLPTPLSATKEGFKALWPWWFSPPFPCASGDAPVTQPGTTRIHNSGPKYRTFFSCIYDSLNSFANTKLNTFLILFFVANHR
jgi:hypothetical protein